MIVKNNCMILSVPEVATLFKLLLTIPMTSAIAERSFSKIKLLKNDLISSIAQVCLLDLNVLTIENERIRSLNMWVEKFVEKNARSQKFM